MLSTKKLKPKSKKIKKMARYNNMQDVIRELSDDKDLAERTIAHIKSRFVDCKKHINKLE